MKNHLIAWLGAIACVMAMASAQQLDAIHAPSAEFVRDLDAAKHCRETHGESGFTWRADGELVCLPRISQMYRNPKK